MASFTTWKSTPERSSPDLDNLTSKHQATSCCVCCLRNLAVYVWHNIYCDNWFTSVGLQTTRSKQGIACLGTVRSNRLPGCTLPADKTMRRQGRGTTRLQTAKIDGVELRATKWFGNRDVVLLSTYTVVEPTTQVERYDRKLRRKLQPLRCYNQHVGGVDLRVARLALCRIPVGSKKWYHRSLFHYLYMLVVQSWLTYTRDEDASGLSRKQQLPLLKFMMRTSPTGDHIMM